MTHDFARTERDSRREGAELAGLYGRDRVTRLAGGTFDTVAFYASLRAEKPKFKAKRRRKKGKAA